MQAELIIIGGGASGTAMLQALAAAARERRLPRGLGRVVLLERSASLGPGLPYGETADPLHTMGRTRTLRRAKGLQLGQRFQEAHAQLVAAGVELVLHVETGARTLSPGRPAAGASARRASRWSRRTWCSRRGTGTSRGCSTSRGRWTGAGTSGACTRPSRTTRTWWCWGWGNRGSTWPLRSPGAARGRPGAGVVRLASRLGLLPGVFGHVGGKQVATRPLEALLPTSEVRLEALFAAVREGEAAVAGRPIEAPVPTPESLRTSLEGADGVALLRRELAAARRSMEEARPIPWHPVLWHGLAAFHALLPRLCAEDRLVLAAHWTPIMRHVEAIHLSSAARLLGFLESGAIELHALGEAPRIGEDAGGVVVQGSRGEVRGTRIVDARGPDPRLSLSDDALVRSVLEAGHVAPGRVAFRAPRPRASRSPRAGAWSARRTRDWLVTGGLWVDPDSFAALDAGGSGRAGSSRSVRSRSGSSRSMRGSGPRARRRDGSCAALAAGLSSVRRAAGRSGRGAELPLHVLEAPHRRGPDHHVHHLARAQSRRSPARRGCRTSRRAPATFGCTRRYCSIERSGKRWCSIW